MHAKNCSSAFRYRSSADAQSHSAKPDRFAVVPYAHKMPHGLKNVAQRYGVGVVFSAPQKLGKMCAQVQSRAEGKRTEGSCGVQHKKKFVPCNKGVVYQLPLSCGKSYMGQSGRCVNTRLGEHRRSLNATTYSRLADHSRACGCYPVLRETTVLSIHAKQTGREIIEAFHIKKLGGDCISQTSISLCDQEFAFLTSTCRYA